MLSIAVGRSILCLTLLTATAVAAAPIVCTDVKPGVNVCRDQSTNNITSVNFSEVNSGAQSENLSFTADFLQPLPQQHQAEFDLLEPFSGGPQTISDKLCLTTFLNPNNNPSQSVRLFFYSDGETGLGGCGDPMVTKATEDGSAQPANFVDSVTGQPFELPIVVTVRSEATEGIPEPTPEPTSIMLLVTGLGSVTFLVRKPRHRRLGMAAKSSIFS